MKKLIHTAKSVLFVILITSPVYFSGQAWIYFSGTITDELTGYPVPQHPVFISDGDSTALSFSTTNVNGIYSDSIEMDSLGYLGEIIVSTPDCNNFMQSHLFPNPDEFNIADFEICLLEYECQAAFYFEYDSLNPYLLHFTDFSFGNIETWNWDFGDGITSELQNPSHHYNSSGIFEVCLQVSDSAENCFSITCDYVVFSDTSCYSDFAWSQSESEDLTVVFEDLSFGEIDKWFWSFGDNEIGNEQSPTHTYSQSGYYLVSLIVSDSSMLCSSYSEQWIFVNEMSDCQADFDISLDTLNNAPYVYHFTNNSAGNYTDWIWDFGDGSFSQELNPTHTYLDGGNYEVCLSIFSNDSVSCSDYSCDSIVTLNYFNFGGHAFLGNYPLNIDENDSSNIALASLYRKIDNKWEFMDAREFWKYGYYWFVDKPEGDYLIRTDLLPMSEAFDLYSPAYSPDVRFWENASTFTLSNSEEYSVDIHLAEMAPRESGIGNISGFLEQEYNCFMDDVISNQLVYLLNTKNEIVAYTYTNDFGLFNFEGLGFDTYLLKAEVTGKSGSSLSVTLTAENPSYSEIVLEIGCESFVGTEENYVTNDFTVSRFYPQPASTRLTVELTGKINNELEYSLLNIYGMVVISGTTSGFDSIAKIELNVSNLSAGIYLIQIKETGHSESVVKKIIVN